ncbi:hypothetical protein GCM10009793_08840 [Brachybacterium phenoliresistens]
MYVPDPSVPEGHDCDPDIYETIALDDGPLADVEPARQARGEEAPGRAGRAGDRPGAQPGIAGQVALGI